MFLIFFFNLGSAYYATYNIQKVQKKPSPSLFLWQHHLQFCRKKKKVLAHPEKNNNYEFVVAIHNFGTCWGGEGGVRGGDFCSLSTMIKDCQVDPVMIDIRSFKT